MIREERCRRNTSRWRGKGLCPSKTPGLDPALVKRYNDRVDTIYKAELCTQEYSRSINEFHEQTTETGRDIRRLFFFSFLMLPMVAYVLGAQYHWFSVSIPYKLLTTLCRNFTIAGLLYSGFLTVIYVIRRIIYRNTRILRHTAFFFSDSCFSAISFLNCAAASPCTAAR